MYMSGNAKGNYHHAIVTFIRWLVKAGPINDDPYCWRKLPQLRTVG